MNKILKIFIIVILIISVSALIVVFTSFPAEMKKSEEINLIDNFNNVNGIVIDSVKLEISEQESYTVNYIYGGKNQGKLLLGDMEDELVEIKANKIIKDLGVVITFNDNFNPEKESNETQYISILYVLFEDGTIGRISTDDIRDKNYNITELNNFVNIEYLKTFAFRPSINAGVHERILCGIEKDTGRVIEIDYNFCP